MNITPLVTPLNASGSSSANTDPGTALAGAQGNTLNQADFLKLLVTQMTSQDPLNPQSNTEFAAQMAQFSSLQAAQGTQAQITTLSSAQQVQQANDLIGRVVTLQPATGAPVQGTVTGVQIHSGVPNLVVNGVYYGLDEVIGISSGPNAAPLNPN